jgi:hypothetical protein
MITKEQLRNKSNLEINGVLFIVENITYTNTFPRRELNRKSIISGTEIATTGKYVPLEFEVTSTITVPINRPDYYNDEFVELQSKIADVVSPLMGSFKAEITINYEPATPETISVKIHIKEVPTDKSNIPGESVFVIPEDKLETEEHKQEREKGKESTKDKDALFKKAREAYLKLKKKG